MATDFDYKAFRLLRAFYDLAEGNPGPPVRGIDAAHKASIDYSWQEYTPMVRHLKDMGWVESMGIVGNGMLRITPAGVREVEEAGGPPMYPAQLVQQDIVLRQSRPIPRHWNGLV